LCALVQADPRFELKSVRTKEFVEFRSGAFA
jgi:hypothetical protein